MPFSANNPATVIQPVPQATVTVGQVALSDMDGQFTDADAGDDATVYTDYLATNRYEYDEGVFMMGLASPAGFQGKAVAHVQIHAPTLLWVCDWTAARFGVQPEVPDPTATNTGWVLLDKHAELQMVQVSPDMATPLYRISGTYIYSHQNPDTAFFADTGFPRPPWLTDIFDRTMPLSKLKAGLSMPVGTVRIKKITSIK